MVISVDSSLAKGFVKQNVVIENTSSQNSTIEFTQNKKPKEWYEFNETVVTDEAQTQDLQEISVQEFNHDEYSKLNNSDKIKVLTQELAHNKFLYVNNKSELEWKNLTSEEKQKLIDLELENFNTQEDIENLAETTVSISLNQKMTLLQTANANNLSWQEFSEKPLSEKQNLVETYLDNLSLMSPENLSDTQRIAINERNSITSTLQTFLKELIAKSPELKAEFGDYLDNEKNMKISEDEIDNILKVLSKKGIKKTKEDLVLDALHEKIEKNLASEEEILRYNETQAIKSLSEKQKFNTDYKHLKSVKDDKNLGKLYNQATAPEDKINILSDYIDNNYEDLSLQEKADNIVSLVLDISASGDIELSQSLLKKVLTDSRGTDLEKLLAQDERLSIQNAVGINSYSKTGRQIIAHAHKHNEQMGVDLAKASLMFANESTISDVSDIYSGFRNEEVETEFANIVLDSKRIKNPEVQMQALKDIHDNSLASVRVNTAIQLDKTHEENQLAATQLFTKEKDANDAMIKNGTFTRFATTNQVEAFKIHKLRTEQDDYSKEDAIKILNTLSDWISSVQNPENQLAMHNEIMTSKYSEVQEHAASNIKNYNPSIQSKALDKVYESKNKKAIETAVKNILLAPECIQQEEFPRIVGEFALEKAEDTTITLLQGKLSIEEIKQLPTAERKKYFKKLFSEASMNEKIKLLNSLPSSEQKKTIYTMIAKFSPSILRAMIERGMGFEMVSYNLPVDATSKIITIMKEMASNNEINRQLKDLQKDVGYTRYFSENKNVKGLKING